MRKQLELRLINFGHRDNGIFFFPKLKLLLRGTRFQSIEDIEENSQ